MYLKHCFLKHNISDMCCPLLVIPNMEKLKLYHNICLHCKTKGSIMAKGCTLHCTIGFLILYIAIVVTLLIFILKTTNSHQGKNENQIHQRKDKIVHEVDLGNKKTIFIIHNVCLNEDNFKET